MSQYRQSSLPGHFIHYVAYDREELVPPSRGLCLNNKRQRHVVDVVGFRNWFAT